MKKFVLIKIAICEDDPCMINIIKEKLEIIFSNKEYGISIHAFLSGELLLQNELLFDLVVMDIELPGINGLETAWQLRNRNWKGNIIILTGHSKYAIQAFDVEPVGYIMKKDIDKLISIIIDILENRKGRPLALAARIWIKNDLISPADIRYVSSFGHKLIYHFCHKRENKMHNESLNTIENVLKNYGFSRIHQSYLVNIRCIKSILNYKVTLDNDETLPIPRYNYQKVKQELLTFSGNFYD